MKYLLVLFLITGCSSTRYLSNTPNYSLSSKINVKEKKWEVLYVTDRLNEKETYGSKRSASVKYGVSKFELLSESNSKVKVSSIQNQEIGAFPSTPIPFKIVNDKVIELPSFKKAYELKRVKLINLIKDRLSSSENKEVILYIHGFNNTFDDAISDTMDIWFQTGSFGVPITYSWPSKGNSILSYFSDRESGEFTIYHLKSFLKVLRDIKELKAVNLVAHSRGTDILTTALRELIIESVAKGNKPRLEFKIKTLTLAAPDLDFDVVKQRLISEKFGQAFDQINIYTNNKDAALEVSESLMSGTRFGRLQDEALGSNEKIIFETIKNVNFITVKDVSSFVGHNYYRKHPGAFSDLIKVITTKAKPGSVERPLNHEKDNFWSLNDSYLKH